MNINKRPNKCLERRKDGYTGRLIVINKDKGIVG